MRRMIEGFIYGRFRGWTPTQLRQWRKYVYGDVQYIGFEVEAEFYNKREYRKWYKYCCDNDLNWMVSYMYDNSMSAASRHMRLDKANPYGFTEIRPLLKNVHDPRLFYRELRTFWQWLLDCEYPLIGSWHVNVSYRNKYIPDACMYVWDNYSCRNSHLLMETSTHEHSRHGQIRFENKKFPACLRFEDFTASVLVYLLLNNTMVRPTASAYVCGLIDNVIDIVDSSHLLSINHHDTYRNHWRVERKKYEHQCTVRSVFDTRLNAMNQCFPIPRQPINNYFFT